MPSTAKTLAVGADRRSIAVLVDEGTGPTAASPTAASPTVVWLGGFRSDMSGSKAEALADWGRGAGHRVVRFDYSGHGRSGGSFEEGTISRWAEEALAVIDAHAAGDVLLVGSSMGGWIALLVARALSARGDAGRLKGLVLVAPAPDFTERLMWPSFTERMRADLADHGRIERPSAYSAEPYVITRALIEDGRRNLVLDDDIRVDAPVHILQGMRDEDVPWSHAMALVDRLVHDDVVVTLVKDGDHRLSRPEDIARLLAAVAALVNPD